MSDDEKGSEAAEEEEEEKEEEVDGAGEDQEPEPEPEPDPKALPSAIHLHLGGGVFGRVAIPEGLLPAWAERALCNDLYWLQKELNPPPPDPAEGAEPVEVPKLEPNMALALELKLEGSDDYELKMRPVEAPASGEGEAAAAEEPAADAEDDDGEGGGEGGAAEEEPEKEDTDIYVDLFTLVCWQGVECATFLLKNGASVAECVDWCEHTVSPHDKLISDNFCAAAEEVRQWDSEQPLAAPDADGEDLGATKKGAKRAPRTFPIDFSWMFAKAARYDDQPDQPLNTVPGLASEAVGDGRTGFFDDLVLQWQVAGCVPSVWPSPSSVRRNHEVFALYRMLLRLQPAQLQALCAPAGGEEAEEGDDPEGKPKAEARCAPFLAKLVSTLRTQRLGKAPAELRVAGAGAPDANGLYRRRKVQGRTLWWHQGGGAPRWKALAGASELVGSTCGGCVIEQVCPAESMLCGGVRAAVIVSEGDMLDVPAEYPAVYDVLSDLIVTETVRGGDVALATLSPSAPPPPGCGTTVTFRQARPGMVVSLTPSPLGEHTFRAGVDFFTATVVRRLPGKILLKWADPEQGGPPAEVGEAAAPFPREREEDEAWWDAASVKTASVIHVEQVENSPQDGLVRGRLLDPPGWVTLLDRRTNHRNATPRDFVSPFASELAARLKFPKELISAVQMDPEPLADGCRRVTFELRLASCIQYDPEEMVWLMGFCGDVSCAPPAATLAWYEAKGNRRQPPPLLPSAWTPVVGPVKEKPPTTLEVGVAQELIPKNKDVEKGTDQLVSSNFGVPVLAGKRVQLWQSDMVLLILATEADRGYEVAFYKFLATKMRMPRKADEAAGFYQLLYLSMPCLSERVCEHIIRNTPTVLGPLAPVPLRHFVSEVASTHRIWPPTKAVLVEVFSQDFLREGSWLDMGNDEMRNLRRAAQEVANAYDMADSALENPDARDGIMVLESLRKQRNLQLCSPEFLYKAVAAGNGAAVSYLLDNGTPPLVRKGPTAAVQDLLPAVVKLQKADLLGLLLHRGGIAGNMARHWGPGEGGCIRYLQRHWPPEEAARALAVWRELERQRGSDPHMQFGLLREAPRAC